MFNRALFYTALLLCSTLMALSYACTTENGAQKPAPKPEADGSSPSKPIIIRQPINPNGDSELALLMRAMYEEAERMKSAIENGEKPEITLDYKAILTAEATEPEKAASDTYKVHAQSYLQTLKALENADVAKAKMLFEDMVDSCMGCHTALCPGPKARIKKLY